MIFAARITRGPCRVIRRLTRKLVKPLLLRVNRHQLALSEQNVRHLDDVRIEVICALNAEHRRQVELMQKRRAVEAW